MEDESSVAGVRVLIEMIDAIGVEQRTAPLDAMDSIALAEQKLGQVGPVLPGNAGDQSYFCQVNPWDSPRCG